MSRVLTEVSTESRPLQLVLSLPPPPPIRTGIGAYVSRRWEEARPYYLRDLRILRQKLEKCREIAEMLEEVDQFYPELSPLFVDILKILEGAEFCIRETSQKTRTLVMGQFSAPEQELILSDQKSSVLSEEQKKSREAYQSILPGRGGRAIFGGLGLADVLRNYTPVSWISDREIRIRFRAFSQLLEEEEPGIIMDFIQSVHSVARFSSPAQEVACWECIRVIRRAPTPEMDFGFLSFLPSIAGCSDWILVEFYSAETTGEGDGRSTFCSFGDRVWLPTEFSRKTFFHNSWRKIQI